MNKNGIEISGAFTLKRSVNENVEIIKLHANKTINGKTYQNSIMTENDTIS
ncbi:hypothetical protein RV06_GL001568 [Enterococcus haemoperoxidus]|nr:hypothetical protein RV06_GL001568 [Enterococcus haemoperoxidus]